jgi:ribosomal protein L37AE/L43A
MQPNLITRRATEQGRPAGADEARCPSCGAKLRYRGRRGAKSTWHCENPACPVVLAELHDPGAKPARGARRAGGRRS